MGNRGGPLHNAAKQIVRRQKNKSWIICLTEFKNRRRALMQPGLYTELFFLDEAMALAAGHRPCYECRRQDALAFADKFSRAQGLEELKAPQIDAMLAHERAVPPHDASRLIKTEQISGLPEGVMVHQGGSFFLILEGKLRPWDFSGYGPEVESARNEIDPLYLVTPVSTVEAIRQGYQPILHPSVRD